MFCARLFQDEQQREYRRDQQGPAEFLAGSLRRSLPVTRWQDDSLMAVQHVADIPHAAHWRADCQGQRYVPDYGCDPNTINPRLALSIYVRSREYSDEQQTFDQGGGSRLGPQAGAQ